jgi:hypothetical protein
VEDARAILAGLLKQLESPATPPAVRLQAAMMANRLALFHGDPSLTDVAESLAVETDEGMPDEIIRGLSSESSVARATRRAIALAHRHQLRSPKDLAMSLVADPVLLAKQVRDQIARGESHLARATLEVARYRHPDDPALQRLEGTVSGPDDNSQPVG